MRIYFIFIFIFLTCFGNAQNAIIEQDFEDVKIDHLGNVYLIYNNIISKYDNTGQFLFSYNHTNNGIIHSIDVTDPMKILIYDQDYNQISFLNNRLSLISDPISLDNLGITLSELACKSAKEGYWVFDASQRDLIYFNNLNQEIHSSIKIDQLIENEESPIFLTEENNFVFLHFLEQGILVFDTFGAFIKKILIQNIRSFQVKENEILYTKKDSLFFYDFQLHATESLPVQVRNAEKIFIANKHFYFILKNKIIISAQNE